ncbi:hypothetical protein D3C83_181240 [compost metagenome]
MGLIDLLNNHSNDKKDTTEYLNLILSSANELDDEIKKIVNKATQIEIKLNNEPKSTNS